jgi:ABC-type lipoprotein release transport system permease subunit
MLLRFALKNLAGAGLRTALNVIVLSLVFVAIVTTQGLLEGMNRQTSRAMIDAEYGGGQYWSPGYDPYDPLSLSEAQHAVPQDLQDLVERGAAAEQLIVQGTIYPEGRVFPVLIRGIDPAQQIIDLPSRVLLGAEAEIPALIGERMARSTGLAAGGTVTLQWRDRNGTFDARDVTVIEVMKTTVQSIDKGQIWVPLGTLRELTDRDGEATLVVIGQGGPAESEVQGWSFKSADFLLTDIRNLILSKTLGSMIVYVILLFLAMLAVFDTQILSIFHRRKEIGTLMAMGLTRRQVTALFTLEGTLIGVFAAVLAVVYGGPALWWLSRVGWRLPETTDSYGFAVGEVLYPYYGPSLVLVTTVILLLVTTGVSYLPARRILRYRATEALQGKLL